MNPADKAVARAAERLGLFDKTESLFRNAERMEGAVTRSSEIELRNQRVLDEGRNLVDALRWQSSGPDAARGWEIRETNELGETNDFARWVRGTGPAPGRGSVMSCDQALLFAAYRADAVDEAALRRLYAEAGRTATSKTEGHSAFYGKINEFLGPGERTPYRININTGLGWPDIPGGHTVFFDVKHTAISLGTRDARGRQEVLSHWIFPKAKFFDSGEEKFGAMQMTSVEELLWSMRRHNRPIDSVESAVPSWLL